MTADSDGLRADELAVAVEPEVDRAVDHPLRAAPSRNATSALERRRGVSVRSGVMSSMT